MSCFGLPFGHHFIDAIIYCHTFNFYHIQLDSESFSDLCDSIGFNTWHAFQIFDGFSSIELNSFVANEWFDCQTKNASFMMWFSYRVHCVLFVYALVFMRHTGTYLYKYWISASVTSFIQPNPKKYMYTILFIHFGSCTDLSLSHFLLLTPPMFFLFLFLFQRCQEIPNRL